MEMIEAQRAKVNGDASTRFCDCPELIFKGKRLPCPHSMIVNTRARDRHLFQLAQNAQPKAFRLSHSSTVRKWTKCFVQENGKALSALAPSTLSLLI
jgi:hypothetical protein